MMSPPLVPSEGTAVHPLVAKYKDLGWRLLFWERKGTDTKAWKGPREKGWNAADRVYDLSKFDPAQHNLGVFTGHEVAPGQFLVDFDLDWAPAGRFVKHFLPETSLGMGRDGKPLSHAFYTTPERIDLDVYCDIADDGDGDGITFFELRGGDLTRMTMIAPSLHSEGVAIGLVGDGPIAHVDNAVLKSAAIDLAIVCLLVKRVPGGLHHDYRMALAGFLLKAGFAPERVIAIGQAVCEEQRNKFVADMTSKDVADMELVVATTRSRLANEKKVAGGPTLAKLIGKHGNAVVRRSAQWIGLDEGRCLDPSDPLRSARVFVGERYTTDEGRLTLRRQGGVSYAFDASMGAYREVNGDTLRAQLYEFLEATKAMGKDGPTPFRPNKNRVSDVIDSLNAVTNLDDRFAPPCWLSEVYPALDPLDMLSCRNGLLHIPTRTLYPSTSEFFSLNGIDLAYDANAPKPEAWLKFLNDLWPEDRESRNTLQEMFGYFLTPDTKFQKIAMMIGPPRSGKGVTGRVLTQLLGERDTCHPTLASFGNQFGKQSLIGKTMAIVSDARIGGGIDTASVAEALLSISGEDPQTVQRKFLPDWNGRLRTRFLLHTNELPRIGDVSGALASRFVIVVLEHSFLNKEDHGLDVKLAKELPGILNWALEGRDRLYERNHFVQPKSAQQLIEVLSDLGSPEAAMLRETTVKKVGADLPMADLFRVWRMWCAENGRDFPGSKQSFGRAVRSALPWVRDRQPTVEGKQVRCWAGLALTAEWERKLDSEPPPPTEM